MRTTKPISTISFNSPDYLALKLSQLTESGILSFWAFCPHLAEDDEGGKKDHLHVYIEPSKLLQTDVLRAELKQYDPTHPDKPLGCLTFRASKFADWYLYALHDISYLRSKGLNRVYHYKHNDIVTSDEDDLLRLSRQIDLLQVSPYADITNAQSQGLTWEQYLRRGLVPLPLIRQWRYAWDALYNVRLQDKYPPVTPLNVNPETGEVDPVAPLDSLQPLVDDDDVSF